MSAPRLWSVFTKNVKNQVTQRSKNLKITTQYFRFVTQRICRDDPSAPDKLELIAQIKELQEKVTQLELENEELRRNILQAGSGLSGQNSAINHQLLDN
ncbi:hypothetical protein Ciccas_006794 [Cichlidogyrus casuarinus]|uniref:Uncharacterized protein n=1 Tax=Cichlidogyrus casuarinus TaxID=1844966 RepID=A0ABD2Q8L2_9PLAT